MLPFFVITPVLIAVLLYVFSSNKTSRFLAIIFQFLLLGFSCYLFLISRDVGITTMTGNYEAGVFAYIGGYDSFLGIYLRAYNMSAVFIMLTTFLFFMISLYSFKEPRGRLYWFLLFTLEASLIGLFLTRDLFNIFVLLEVSTIVVTVLLMFDKQRRNMFHGMVFLMINVVVMQFYLLGLGYLYSLTGAFDISQVAEVVAGADRAHVILAYSLIMAAMAFKCALIPLFSFTPKTNLYRAAPSAIAALLSGIQIKTNVYLFFRLQEVFGIFAMHDFFLALGITASLVAVFMAISQSNIKMILAYHTISQVGLIIIGISLQNDYSIIGGLYHVISHGIFKPALFLTAGIIYRAYGTRNVYEIRGVMKRMPVIGMAMLAAVLGIIGAPFFIGSVSKYFISYDVHPLINWITILISLGTIISFIKYSGMLFGNPKSEAFIPEKDKWRIVPAVILGVLCLVGGVFGGWFVNFFFGTSVSINLAGYAQKSLIFFVSLAVGFLIYRYVVSGNKLLKTVSGISFGFKSVCVSVGLMLSFILAFAHLI